MLDTVRSERLRAKFIIRTGKAKGVESGQKMYSLYIDESDFKLKVKKSYIL